MSQEKYSLVNVDTSTIGDQMGVIGGRWVRNDAIAASKEMAETIGEDLQLVWGNFDVVMNDHVLCGLGNALN